MKTEFEAQFPNINKDEIRKKLSELGATLVQEEVVMKRKNYDFDDGILYKRNGWVRLRDEGNQITLTYKQLHDRSISGMKEACIAVDSWESAEFFLSGIGLLEKTYQETKRESWKIGDVEIEIDEWPWAPPFIEIEAADEGSVKAVTEQMGFKWSEAMFGSVENIYQMVFDVTEAEIDGWQEIIFSEVPDWLELKRK